MTGALDELAGALAAFQAEVPVIPKRQTAQVKSERGASYSYTYADLATIAPVVMPLLAKHGLAFTATPKGGKGDRGPVLVGILLHTSGQSVAGELPITGRTPQEIGSSLTYGRRYLLGCLTGVVTDDDDDGALAERAARPRKAQPKRSPGEDPPPPVAPPIQRRTRPGGAAPADPPEVSPHGSPEISSEAAPVTDSMRRALFGAIGKALPDAQRAERLALCSAILGREVESSNDLDGREVSRILDWLERQAAGQVDWSYDPYEERGYVYVLDPAEAVPSDHE